MTSAGSKSVPKPRRPSARSGAQPASAPTAPRTLQAFWLPLALTLGLFLLSFLPRVQVSPALVRSFWGASGALLAWQIVLFLRLGGASATRTLLLTAPRAQHWVPAMVQLSVYASWGRHWRQV